MAVYMAFSPASSFSPLYQRQGDQELDHDRIGVGEPGERQRLNHAAALDQARDLEPVEPVGEGVHI